jgi:PAS domain S-box-containing protein
MMVRTRFTIRQGLMAFAAALLAPALIFAAVLLWGYSTSQREQHEQDARDAAHRIIATVDRELISVRAVAQALATSNLLREGHYEAFQKQAEVTVRTMSADSTSEMAIVVRDTSGQQVVNTRLPWGTPLPKGPGLQANEEVIASRRPVFQDLFLGAVASRPVISVGVPVPGEAGVSHILSIALDRNQFTEILRSENLPQAWVATLLDRSDYIVARSHGHEEFFGLLAPDDFRSIPETLEGPWAGRDLSGAAMTGAHARSGVAGWRVFVAAPTEVLQAPLRRSLWITGALSALLIALSFLLASYFGRPISKAVQALARSARDLGRGERPNFVATGLVEIEEVSRVLAASAAELAERENALRESEGRLRATHENAAVGIAEVDREGRLLSVNEARCRISGHTREELIGTHFAEQLTDGRASLDYTLFQRQVAGIQDSYTVENESPRKDGTRVWVRVSSTAVRDAKGAFLYAVRVGEDITERRRVEERQKLLIGELNHRVKNTLATVQSLAWQSMRQGLSPEATQKRFQDRLLSLSRTHDLLNETSWEGASLRDILQKEFAPHIAEAPRFTLRGPEVDLPPKTAVVLGMVLHELVTNAMKYGALSVPGGRVDVEWHDTGPGALQLTWQERGGPAVEKPATQGFGSRLIAQAINHELAGTVDLNYDPDGFRCRFSIPLDQPLDQVA